MTSQADMSAAKPCRIVGEDGTCTFSCEQCAAQFAHAIKAPECLQPKRTISDEQAALRAEILTSRCENLRQNIRGGLAEYGDALCAKWKKKSKAKRVEMMLRALPTIEHHAHLDARLHCEIESAKYGYRKTAVKTCDGNHTNLLLQYVNLETLQHEPMRLLSLLHYRAEFPLEDWVSYDIARVQHTHRVGIVHNDSNLSCVVMRGAQSGTLVPYNEEKCHRLEIVGWPLADIVRKMQFHLLEFLNKMLSELIDPEATAHGNQRWKALTRTGFKLAGSVECWSGFANPFSSPPSFHAMSCLQQLEAHLAESEDHYRLLQTDPEYLQTNLKARVDALKDERNKEVSQKLYEPWCWEMIAATILFDMSTDIFSLRWLVKQCRHVFWAELDTIIAPGTDAAFESAVTGLYRLAAYLCNNSKCNFGWLLNGSAGFSSSYTIRSDKKGRVNSQMPLKQHLQLINTDKLHYFLTRLNAVLPRFLSTEEADLFACIEEHLAKADHRERARIDPAMNRYLSTTAIFQQIETTISLHHPYVGKYKWTEEEKKIDAAYLSSREILPGPGVETPSERRSLGTALRKFYEHPWPKGNRNEDWLAKADEVRKHMASFWKTARENYKRNIVGQDYPAHLVDQCMALLEADLSADHLAEVAAARTTVLQRIAERKERSTVRVAPAPAPAQTLWGKEFDGPKIEIAVDRCKPKTRPAEASNAIQALTDEDIKRTDSVVEEPTAQIPVNAESMRIFSRLFANADESSKGIVKWQQIVTALCDAGMVGTNVGGSAVNFKLLSGDSKPSGSIVFHKPHPDPNVDLFEQRRMGTRLNKWFGWNMDSFVERNKAKNE